MRENQERRAVTGPSASGAQVVQRREAPGRSSAVQARYAGVAPSAQKSALDWHRPWFGGRYAVQRKEEGDAVPAQADDRVADPFDIRAIAEQGVSGPAAGLPHGERIQKSFGKHDVGGVRAHVGGSAFAATHRLGAVAYATGDHIAFGSQPDLHTAAHEAAHVVQQRAGVQLEGGVGEAGDAYEQQADRAADAAVRGESAERILGGGALRASATGRAVQRKEADAGPTIGMPAGQTPGAKEGQGRGDADGEGSSGRDGGPTEDPGLWTQQRLRTAFSFCRLISANSGVVDTWGRAAGVEGEPDPSWRDVIATVGMIAASAFFGALAGIVVKKLTDSDTRLATEFSIRAAAEGGKNGMLQWTGNALKSGERRAVAEGIEKKAALYAFVDQQRQVLDQAGFDAVDAFLERAGTETKQKLTVAQMTDISENNKASASEVHEPLLRELTVGWMGLLGGKDAIDKADLNEVGNKGTLGVELVGRESEPVRISRAKAQGFGPLLRAQLSGTNVGYWVRPESGVSVVMMTRQNDFFPSRADLREILDAGAMGDAWYARARQKQHRARVETLGKVSESWASDYQENIRMIPENAASIGSINFGVGRRPDGSYNYISDFGCWEMSDDEAGYTAGRYFLEKMRSMEWLLQAVSSLALPGVE